MAYSRAGYEESDACDLPRPLDYLTREAVDVLPEVLDAIGFRRGVLMRHSDGATIAAIHAGSVADRRVRGLVLMAPHFFAEVIGLAEIARARDAFENGDLAQCRAAVAGRTFLEADYLWETHEVLEAVWLACPPNSAEQVCVRGVIQLANARLKVWAFRMPTIRHMVVKAW